MTDEKRARYSAPRRDRRSPRNRRLNLDSMVETTEAVDTRQLIVDAAALCFRQVGLRRSTIVEVASVAGISRATVYSYFKDKAAIVEAVAESTSQDFYRRMLEAMSREMTLEGRLSAAAVFVTQSRAEVRRYQGVR